MTIQAMPLWLALPVGTLLLLAGFLCISGGAALIRLSNFYQRMHGPAMITTLATGCVLIASMLFFSVMKSRPVLHELLITAVVLLTAPVTSMMLARAAVTRDRRSGRDGIPPKPGEHGGKAGTGDLLE